MTKSVADDLAGLELPVERSCPPDPYEWLREQAPYRSCGRKRARRTGMVVSLVVGGGQPLTCSPKPERPAGSSPSFRCSEGIS